MDKKITSVQIYEDQTGFMMFPEKSLKKDINIVKLFDNKVDLYLKKIEKEDVLTIICYALVAKGQERAIGCYIIGECKYTDNMFANFKDVASNTLKKMGFELHPDKGENEIFNNIEKFDSLGGYSSNEDIYTIMKVLESNEYLNYKSGNIGEIIAFCRQILNKINNVKMAISTEDTNLGDINISRNVTYEERLVPTSEGKKILEMQKAKIAQKLADEEIRKATEKKKLEDENKRKEGEVGENKINEGMVLIKDGLLTIRKAGYNDLEIECEIKRINSTIMGRPLPEKIQMNEDNDDKGGGSRIWVLTLATIVILAGLATSSWIYGYPIALRNMVKGEQVSEPTPVPIPKVTETPIPTDTQKAKNITEMPTVQNNTTFYDRNGSVIPSNNSSTISRTINNTKNTTSTQMTNKTGNTT